MSFQGKMLLSFFVCPKHHFSNFLTIIIEKGCTCVRPSRFYDVRHEIFRTAWSAVKNEHLREVGLYKCLSYIYIKKWMCVCLHVCHKMMEHPLGLVKWVGVCWGGVEFWVGWFGREFQTTWIVVQDEWDREAVYIIIHILFFSFHELNVNVLLKNSIL